MEYSCVVMVVLLFVCRHSTVAQPTCDSIPAAGTQPTDQDGVFDTTSEPCLMLNLVGRLMSTGLFQICEHELAIAQHYPGLSTVIYRSGYMDYGVRVKVVRART